MQIIIFVEQLLAQAEIGHHHPVCGRVQDNIAQLQVSVDNVFLERETSN